VALEFVCLPVSALAIFAAICNLERHVGAKNGRDSDYMTVTALLKFIFVCLFFRTSGITAISQHHCLPPFTGRFRSHAGIWMSARHASALSVVALRDFGIRAICARNDV